MGTASAASQPDMDGCEVMPFVVLLPKNATEAATTIHLFRRD